jgi:putative NADH-flavin reductase
VRDPSKLTDKRRTVEVVEADVLDPENVSKAVAGADAVVSVIGHTKTTPRDLQRRGAGNIVAAMRSHGVRRLVVLTGAGVRFPDDAPGAMDVVIRFALKLLQPAVLADSEAYAEVVKDSGLDWTIVRAPMLHDGPASPQYTVGHVGKGPGPRASRDTVARFILDVLERGSHVGEAPMVSD